MDVPGGAGSVVGVAVGVDVGVGVAVGVDVDVGVGVGCFITSGKYARGDDVTP